MDHPIEIMLAKAIGVIKADLFEPDGDIVMASAQTLHRRLELLNSNMFDVVVCDEVHLFMSNTFQKSINHHNYISVRPA